VVAVATVSACGGFLAVWLPWYLAGSHKNMIDGMQPVSPLILGLLGVVGGVIAPRRVWVVGLCSVSLFPVIGVVQAIRDPASHNLLGIELVGYGVLAIPTTLGAAIGRGVARVVPTRRDGLPSPNGDVPTAGDHPVAADGRPDHEPPRPKRHASRTSTRHDNSTDLLAILGIAHDTSMRGEGLSLGQALARTHYKDRRAGFGPEDLRTVLDVHRDFVEEWLAYSEDKRTSGGWYLTRSGEIGELGDPDSRVRFGSLEEAVAEYVVRELDFWTRVSKAG
jgi:hypothetical protein